MDRVAYGIGVAMLLILGSLALLTWAFKSEPEPLEPVDESEDEIEKYNREWLDKPMDNRN